MWLRFNGSVRRVAAEAVCAPVGYNQPLVCGAVISPNGEALRRKVSRDMSVLTGSYANVISCICKDMWGSCQCFSTICHSTSNQLAQAGSVGRHSCVPEPIRPPSRSLYAPPDPTFSCQIRPSAARLAPQLPDQTFSCCQIRPSAASVDLYETVNLQRRTFEVCIKTCSARFTRSILASGITK